MRLAQYGCLRDETRGRALQDYRRSDRDRRGCRASRDLAITADIRLAARCLERGARVLGPTGKPFTESGIGMALAMRDLNEYLRDSGEIRGGGPGFSRKDRSRFLEALEQAIQSLKREGARTPGQ